MDVAVSRMLLDHLVALAAASPDAEICGLLTGRSPDRIEDAIPAANVASAPARAFEVDPATLFGALRAERAGRARLLGHYHSHPGGDPAPSPRDAAAVGPDGTLWLILGHGVGLWRAARGGPVLGAFEPARLIVTDGIARSAASRHKGVVLGQWRG